LGYHTSSFVLSSKSLEEIWCPILIPFVFR